MTPSLNGRITSYWYAISTRSRHEKVVRQQLAEKNIEAFLPTVMRWSRWKDRRKKVDWPLFPGYCFARVAPDDLLPILKCVGVRHVVSFAGAPVAIPDVELDGVRLLVNSALPFDPHPSLREGALVEVVHGPLRGIVGRLLRKDTHHASIVLSVDLIGHGVRVEVSSADVTVH
jgi:transcription termination/antitermination protein NusG